MSTSVALMVVKLNRQLQWFGRQMRPLIWSYSLSVSLILLSSLMFLLDPLLIKWLIDQILPKKDFRLLVFAVGGFLGVYLCRLGLSAVAEFVGFRTVQGLVFRIRLSLLEQMNRLSVDYHETIPVGERLYRMEQDVDQVAELGSSLVPYVLQTAFNTVFVVGTMFVLDFRLTCIVIPLMPCFLAWRRYFEGRLREASDSAQLQSSMEMSFLQEYLASVIQIQLLHQEKRETEGFVERAKVRMQALNHRSLIEILFSTCYMGVVALGTIAILGYGGHDVFVGALTVGGLVAFYSYMARLFDPLHAAVEIYSRVNRLSASIRRVLEVIELKPNVRERANAVDLVAPVRGRVEIDGVSFSYGNRHAVLERIELKLEAGEKVALVGVSGSGKSTLVKLLARLYDVTSGAVYIDGIDVRNIRLDCLRTKVCYVMQDTILFDRTLRENLLLGKPSATSRELNRAIEIADLEELLHRLPNSWGTPLGPRGNRLSGGERQRLALARVVLQNPSLLLLDESTSALDAPGERKILSSLAQHFSDQTIVFISHRISGLKWVDRIIVLNRGVVGEQGTHDQLMRGRGLYSFLQSTHATAVGDERFYPGSDSN